VTDKLLTARELGEYLGLSASTILDWWEAGRIPGFKLGQAVRFRSSEVEAWLEAHRAGPKPSRGPKVVA
jgi:excisionase family DNA binding protein